MNPKSKYAFHFLQSDGRLRGGQEAVLGKVYRVEPPLVLCEHGLHFSYRAIDALQYAESAIVTIVKVGGTVIVEGDKGCCSRRTPVAGPVDATDTLRAFSLWCALQVIHLWDCPPIVKEYLETGKEELRSAAWDAARAAAGDAAGDAAWDAAGDAAGDAARDAAKDAARAAARAAAGAAAGAAARAAARAAAYGKYNDRLEVELLKLLKFDPGAAQGGR